jgi:hypothetical protein
VRSVRQKIILLAGNKRITFRAIMVFLRSNSGVFARAGHVTVVIVALLGEAGEEGRAGSGITGRKTEDGRASGRRSPLRRQRL